nr:transcriptional regulator [Mesorhizobium silamurunense]
MNSANGHARRNQPVNDNEERPVTIITGRVWKKKGGKPEGVHVMLVAPDDDSAVRRALESLAAEGYAEAELDQIGDMDGVPDEEPHLSAYQGALEGEVSIVTFDEPV